LGVRKKYTRDIADGKIGQPRQRVTQSPKVRDTCTEGSSQLVGALTNREKTVINYVLQGWYSREISRQLSVSENTVRKYLRSICVKLGVVNQLELVLFALHEHLDLPPLGPLGTHA
jgi:DNA-binding CsgD family transcriptional regulator